MKWNYSITAELKKSTDGTVCTRQAMISFAPIGRFWSVLHDGFFWPSHLPLALFILKVRSGFGSESHDTH